ncbi:phosphotyrosine protein phosphatases I, partial [Rhizodiscina lignyota]
STKPVSVLFVCLGNYCRSPMAEAVFAHMTASNPLISKTDSCGTGAYHAGSYPDPRTQAILQKNAITDYVHVARKVRPEDFIEFDWVMGMDSDNILDLQRVRQRATKLMEKEGKGEEGLAKLCLFGDFGRKDKRGRGEEVIDPYYGADNGFDIAFEQMGRFTKGFLEYLE